MMDERMRSSRPIVPQPSADRGRPVLSVIIPTFNMEEFVQDCLDSIVAGATGLPRTGEILIVDDASSDATVAAVRKWSAASGIPVRILEQSTNLGLGQARITGCGAALGKFLWFVDADDLVGPETLYAVLEGIANAHERELVMIDTVLSTETVPGDSLIVKPYHRSALAAESHNKLIDSVISPDAWIRDYFAGRDISQIWNKIIPRSIASKALEPLRYSEDVASMIKIMPNVLSVRVVSGSYIYRIRDSSLSHRSRNVLEVDIGSLDEIDKCWNELSEEHLEFVQKWASMYRMNQTRRVIHRIHKVLSSTGPSDEKKKISRNLIKRYSPINLWSLWKDANFGRREALFGVAMKFLASTRLLFLVTKRGNTK